MDQRRAIEGADFVIVAFQIGGYKPCTVTDFDLPKRYGLRQTIADTLGIGGIMRGLRTVPHLWKLAEDMARRLPRCDHAAICEPDGDQHLGAGGQVPRHPPRWAFAIRCRARRPNWHAIWMSRSTDLRYRAAGINHMAFYLNFEARKPDGSYRDLYPALRDGYRKGAIPKPSHWNARCPNKVRYEVMTHLGSFRHRKQ